MKTKRFLPNFLGSLLLVLGMGLLIHISFRHLNSQELIGDQLLVSYVLNFFLALTIVVLLYTYRFRIKHQVGFLFMAGTALKFLFFFLLIYPEFMKDHKIQSAEFATFFIPYALALITETISAAKLLRIMEHDDLHSQSE